MPTLTRFEDIEAWKVARALTRRVYACSAQRPFSRDFGLRDQIRKAAVSVMSNIAEGFERGGVIEFNRFLGIAKGSAGEVQSQLYVALDAGYIGKQQFDDLQELARSSKRLIAGFMHYLQSKSKNRKGSKQSNQQPATSNQQPAE